MLPKIGDMFSMLLVLERVLNMLSISNFHSAPTARHV